MKILMTGATGFIGSQLIDDFYRQGYEISILTRAKKRVQKKHLKVYFHIDEISSDAVFYAVINLAGAPINRRWSAGYKKELMDSRVHMTQNLYQLVERLHEKPKMLINASAVGYYGHRADAMLDEDSTPVEGFTHELCARWEQVALELKKLGVRVVIIRLGVVLGLGGGMLKETAPIFKMGLGGQIGNGQQYLSWVHIADVVRAIEFLLLQQDAKGVYNLAAPFAVTNNHWTRSLAQVLKRPAIFPLPAVVVKILFGEMGESLLLQGQKVTPKRLLDAGFQFKYPKVEAALLNIFRKSVNRNKSLDKRH